jgi:hypothetical protein
MYEYIVACTVFWGEKALKHDEISPCASREAVNSYCMK